MGLTKGVTHPFFSCPLTVRMLVSCASVSRNVHIVLTIFWVNVSFSFCICSSSIIIGMARWSHSHLLPTRDSLVPAVSILPAVSCTLVCYTWLRVKFLSQFAAKVASRHAVQHIGKLSVSSGRGTLVCYMCSVEDPTRSSAHLKWMDHLGQYFCHSLFLGDR